MTLEFLFCLQLSLAAPDTSPAFADALFRQEDYFRAISEYKRVLFYNSNDSIKNYCLVQIAKSYRKSFKYESAIRYSAALLNRAELSPALRRQGHLNLGLSYLESKMPQLALPYFQAAVANDSTAFPFLCMGLTELEKQNWDGAANWFRKAASTRRDSLAKAQIMGFSNSTAKLKNQSWKSPLLSSALSLVVPGSGQFYSGHVYDGVQAFLFTMSFAFATYATYKYEHAFNEHLRWTYAGVSVTAIFHAANVIGANRTARYRNWKKRSDFTKSVHDAVMLYEP
jgi:tetratricopeptide (TPR) repeat protein